MIGAVYIEDEVADHPRTAEILERLPDVPRISCRRWGEVFNRRGQSFRLQKRRPSVILARKHDGHVLPVPDGYGVGVGQGFYFSHMLNCPYDCRYCFLQGMYRSAHYVVFVNYEDFFGACDERLSEADEDCWFFSGYDCDSLAFDGVTGFADEALRFFRGRPSAWLEIRTKSVHLAPLLAVEPYDRCIVAFSFTPREISEALENGVPTVPRRLAAMRRLADHGWPLGLRFDPLIYSDDYRDLYRRLFAECFAALEGADLHSVSLGSFRLPRAFFGRLEKLYPEEPLLAGPLSRRGGMVSYHRQLEDEMIGFCAAELASRVPAERFFPCGPAL